MFYDMKLNAQAYKRQKLNSYTAKSAHYKTKFYAMDCRITFNTVFAGMT